MSSVYLPKGFPSYILRSVSPLRENVGRGTFGNAILNVGRGAFGNAIRNIGRGAFSNAILNCKFEFFFAEKRTVGAVLN